MLKVTDADENHGHLLTPRGTPPSGLVPLTTWFEPLAPHDNILDFGERGWPLTRNG